MTEINTVGLVYAMASEATLLIKQLGFHEVPKKDEALPILFYETNWEGVRLCLTTSGEDRRYGVPNVGTNAAVLAAQLLSERYPLDLLVNPGTAGGFQSRGAQIGDVYLGKRDVRFFDRRTPVSRYQESFEGRYPIVEASRLANLIGAKLGHVCTGNSFDCHEGDWKSLETHDAHLKEMEAAAIGWVAWLKGIPFLPIKAVTDWVEHHETVEAQFIQNYKSACRNLTATVVKGLSAMIQDKTLIHV